MFRGILCLVKDLFWQDKKQTTWWEEKKGSDRFFSPQHAIDVWTNTNKLFSNLWITHEKMGALSLYFLNTEILKKLQSLKNDFMAVIKRSL